MAPVCFFQQLGAHSFRLAGKWLYYGFYRLPVLAAGGVLLTASRPGHRLEAFQNGGRMMDLIDSEFTRAGLLGHMDARFCLYQYDLCNYVGLAVRVMRMCH